MGFWKYLSCKSSKDIDVFLSKSHEQFELLVAFSCKKRGFCPSCGAKRMAETASHLVENIFPQVGIRQYVLSMPIPLRYWMASSKKLTGEIHRIFASSVEKFYTAQRAVETTSGSIAFVQRFGSALNLNVHLHMLQIEGSYQEDPSGTHRFSRGSIPCNQDIENLVEEISSRVIRLLRRRGFLGEASEDPKPDPLFEEEPAYASCMSASVQNRIALGLRKGKSVRFIGSGFGYEGEQAFLKSSRCVQVNGFSLHANVVIRWHRRDQLEKLIGYVARSSLSTKRMSLSENGDIKYELKNKWSNGATHVLLSPLELIEKLCALVPLPRMHLVRYWGVLAPNSRLRKGVIPGKTRAELKEREEEQEESDKEKKSNSKWSKLLARVFQIDVSKCPKCKGEMKIIASIMNREVVEKILTCLGLSPQPPPIARALFQELN